MKDESFSRKIVSTQNCVNNQDQDEKIKPVILQNLSNFAHLGCFSKDKQNKTLQLVQKKKKAVNGRTQRQKQRISIQMFKIQLQHQRLCSLLSLLTILMLKHSKQLQSQIVKFIFDKSFDQISQKIFINMM
ncbi:unnamed protein product (macronuclear) [Paramecium tetraurelia]|uniref:Transmembrane protein n=1 Tax=Paramecium tetraurelia TaxID=5888 RepID=A0BGT6_PARTE|nr:uncharacterized protein GSPATT00028788001 [Paramecium tetraurelia]CAK57753.1 unnamed protein product [Paramecium tetraurelia]|eukprot:XP_001425151.1 hypothetical protein (macronuclear) [Paramecium tetraurelia strain d4-2]